MSNTTKFVTQKEVDAAIEHFLKAAEPFEAARDASVYESAAYWENHDAAMNLILSAESLMP